MAGVKGMEFPGSGRSRSMHFLSPENFSSPWATWMLRSGFCDLVPMHQHLRSQRGSMTVQCPHGSHGNQRCFRSWLLQTKIENKGQLCGDSERTEEVSEGQGSDLPRSGMLTSWPS